MFCTSCGVKLQAADRFCTRCGKSTAARLPEPAGYRHLLRDSAKRKVAGVCAGFARYFGVDVTLVRVVVLILVLCTGVGFLAYLAAWIVIPADSPFRAHNFSVNVVKYTE